MASGELGYSASTSVGIVLLVLRGRALLVLSTGQLQRILVTASASDPTRSNPLRSDTSPLRSPKLRDARRPAFLARWLRRERDSPAPFTHEIETSALRSYRACDVSLRHPRGGTRRDDDHSNSKPTKQQRRHLRCIVDKRAADDGMASRRRDYSFALKR
jgi:hypothetical protein